MGAGALGIRVARAGASMQLDLELELFRVAHAFAAPFPCAEVVAYLEETTTSRRISHPLVAHLVESLAETLVHAGFLDRTGTDRYALTDRGLAYLRLEPAILGGPVQGSEGNDGVDVSSEGPVPWTEVSLAFAVLSRKP